MAAVIRLWERTSPKFQNTTLLPKSLRYNATKRPFAVVLYLAQPHPPPLPPSHKPSSTIDPPPRSFCVRQRWWMWLEPKQNTANKPTYYPSLYYYFMYKKYTVINLHQKSLPPAGNPGCHWMNSSWPGIFLKFGDFWNLPLPIWENTRTNLARKTKIPEIQKVLKYSGPGRVYQWHSGNPAGDKDF